MRVHAQGADMSLTRSPDYLLGKIAKSLSTLEVFAYIEHVVIAPDLTRDVIWQEQREDRFHKVSQTDIHKTSTGFPGSG